MPTSFPESRPDEAPVTSRATIRLVLMAVGALGVSCVMTQLALMRELLEAFSGNEMVLGIVLGLWLLLMGLGAWLARFVASAPNRGAVFAVFQMAAAMVPLVQVLAVRGLRNVVFRPGADVGVNEILAGTFLVLLPYCLVAGGTLTLACAWLGRRPGLTGAGYVYAADGLGSIVGGLLFLVLVNWSVGHVQLLVWPGVVNLLAAAALAASQRRRALCLAGIVGIVSMVGTVFAARLESASTAWQFPHQVVRAAVTSPYGKIVVTESAGQLNFIENGLPIFSTHQVQQIEETVHYAMAQRPQARRVLLVSGGVSGTAQEIRKYGALSVDDAELDPRLVELGSRFLPGSLAGVRLATTDGRLFIQRAREPYDVVIVDVPPPATAQLNRFYTVEFFAGVKKALAPNGVLAFGLGQYENYVSPELARLLSCARISLTPSFRTILLLPGGRVYFLASDGPLFSDVVSRLKSRQIQTQYMNRHYLDAMLTPDRLADVVRAAAQPAEANRDFTPVLYYYHLRHWLRQFGTGIGLLPVALALAFCVYLVRLRGAALVLCASGFAGSAIELVLLLIFQVLCGSVYHQVAIIVTSFMAGLAAGAMAVLYWERRSGDAVASSGVSRPAPTATLLNPKALLFRLAILVAVLAALLAPGLQQLAHIAFVNSSPFVVKSLLAILTFGLAVLIGMQFPLAVRLCPGGGAASAARLYTADFVGASLGALVASTLLIPLLGITGLGILTAVLNAAAGVLLYFPKATS